MRLLVRLWISTLALLAGVIAAEAQTSEERGMSDAIGKAYATGTVGPAVIPLRDLATLKLPKGLVFVPAPASHALLHGMGNGSDVSVLGVVIPSGRYTGWFVAVTMLDTGHVGTADIAKLDPSDIRGTLATATRRGNAARMMLGSGPLDVGAFLEPPKHEPELNRYTTAVRVYESGPSTGSEDSANVDAYLFGRVHTVQISLVDGLSDYAQRRPFFNAVRDGVSFVDGQRAADYVTGRDPVARHLLDVLFGGRTEAELEAEATEAAAEAKRHAMLPPVRSLENRLKLAFFAVLALLSVGVGALALSAAKRSGSPTSARPDAVLDRALRTAKR
jgi:uncharacterized membrane-anchored protein